MLDVEAGTTELYCASDGHVIPETSWLEESRARAHERKAVEIEVLEHVDLVMPSARSNRSVVDASKISK